MPATPDDNRSADETRQAPPLLHLKNAADRMDYMRLVLFHDFLRYAHVQEAIMQVIRHNIHGNRPRRRSGEKEAQDIITIALSEVLGQLDLSLDFTGSTSRPGAARTITYNLAKTTKVMDGLERLVGCARQLPEDIFPPEARPTGGFLARCRQIAGTPAAG